MASEVTIKQVPIFKLVPVLDIASALHDATTALFTYSEKFKGIDIDDAKILCYKKIQNYNTPTQIKQLFNIAEKILEFKILIEHEEQYQIHMSREYYGPEMDAYFSEDYDKLSKDDPRRKSIKQAYETKKDEYEKIIAPRNEPLKKALDTKQAQKKLTIKMAKTEELKNAVVSNIDILNLFKPPAEEDPSNSVAKITPPIEAKAPELSVDDLLFLIPNEPAVPAPVIPNAPVEAPAPTNDVSITVRKKAIPKHVKTLVWNTYVGVDKLESKCFSCRAEKIDARYFQCGHVIAESKGGDLTMKNLRPICAPCNSSMGTKSMNEFTKEYFGWEV